MLIVSATDSRFLPLLRGMLASLRDVLRRPNVSLACLDIGLAPADREWLGSLCTTIVEPGSQFGLDAAAHPPALRSFLARPFLPEIFPGFDIYVWIDSDVWLQSTAVFDRYVEAARRTGFAIAHESERAYRLQPYLFAWTSKHFLKGYGPWKGPLLLARRHLNAGFFAGRAGAPHWAAWARNYEAAIRRSGNLVPHDQFALVQTVHEGRAAGRGGLVTEVLGPENNWICDRGIPMWNDDAACFCKPYAPFEPIGAMHLAGPGKGRPYRVRRTRGGSFTSFLTFGASPEHPVSVAPAGVRPPAAAPSPSPTGGHVRVAAV